MTGPFVETPGLLVVRGRPIAPGLACGPLRRNRPDLEPKHAEGAVLLAERAVPDDVGRILVAAGTLTLSGAVLSHVSLLSREFGKASVSLSGITPARLARPGEDGLLVLEDIVGGRGAASLDDGDIVLLDGRAGLVSIAGALDRDARQAARRVFGPLAAFGKLPDDEALLAALLRAAADEGDATIAFLLAAALPYRLVPPGAPARRLIEALARARPRLLAERVAAIQERVLDEAAARCDEATLAIASVEDLEELQRTLRRLESDLDRDLRLLEDLGGDPDRLERRLEPVLAAAGERRASLETRLRDEVAEALALGEDVVRSRLGGLFRLLRRARAARFDHQEIERLHTRLALHLAEERRRRGTHLVVPLELSAPHERALVGGKAAGLVEAVPALPEGCRVPSGFVVTAAAYRLHLLGEIGERLRIAMDAEDEAAVSRKARAALLAGEIPDEVRDAVAVALDALGAPRVAVRSSATIEDGPVGSLAGLFDSYLGVQGLPEVLDRIRWAWGSLWNRRALAALTASGLSPLRASQAVLVQEMVETRAAGVLFSRDPTGRPDTLLVNAAWGLGEGISQGEVGGDLYWVRRSSGELLASDSGHATRRIELAPEGIGTVDAPLSPDQIGRPCLDASDLGRLARLARSLEEVTGGAQEVELGLDVHGGLVIFQVRRIVPRRAERD